MISPHEQLDCAANWNGNNGIINCLLALCCCCFTSGWWAPEAGRLLSHLAIYLIALIIPAIVLFRCARLIREGSKTAVTVAVVLCSLNLAAWVCLLVLCVIAAVLLWGGRKWELFIGVVWLPLAVSGIMTTTLSLNIFHLARCYRAIRDLGLTGRRGFEPVMPLPVQVKITQADDAQPDPQTHGE